METPLRTLLTLTGVALGIAVVVAVHLANDRAIGSFNDSLRILNGRPDLQIAANGLDLDENLVGELSWVWDVGVMTAIIEGRIHLEIPSDTPFRGESLRLFGVDLLSDAPFRTYMLTEGGRDLGGDIAREDFIDLLVEPDAVIIPARPWRMSWNVAVGDTVSFLIANRFREFTLGAVLTDEGIARAFDGKIVFMDIAAAQLVFGRLGKIDRIEVLLEDSSMADAVAERIHIQLPESVVVYRPEDTTGETEKVDACVPLQPHGAQLHRTGRRDGPHLQHPEHRHRPAPRGDRRDADTGNVPADHQMDVPDRGHAVRSSSGRPWGYGWASFSPAASGSPGIPNDFHPIYRDSGWDRRRAVWTSSFILRCFCSEVSWRLSREPGRR